MPTTPKPKTAARNVRKFVRNLTRSQVAFRIGGREGRRVDLNPRGNRADLAPVTKEELGELDDVGVLYEIITDAEAKEIIGKQTTNQSVYHPALAQLRNEYGNEYERAVVVEEQNGFAVASLEEDGRGMKINRHPREGIVTQDVKGPTQVPVAGSVMRAEQVDAVARSKAAEGPSAGGVTAVKLSPVTRS